MKNGIKILCYAVIRLKNSKKISCSVPDSKITGMSVSFVFHIIDMKTCIVCTKFPYQCRRGICGTIINKDKFQMRFFLSLETGNRSSNKLLHIVYGDYDGNLHVFLISYSPTATLTATAIW